MQSWNIVITSPWQVVTAVVAVATAFTAIDKAWDTLLAKWKKHKAPEEAQNAEISALKTQIQQITPRLDAVEGQLTAMGKTVDDLHAGNLAVLHDRIYQMCRLCIKRGMNRRFLLELMPLFLLCVGKVKRAGALKFEHSAIFNT